LAEETAGPSKSVNINVQAAFVHVIGDALQSVGVMIAASLIWSRPNTLWSKIELFLNRNSRTLSHSRTLSPSRTLVVCRCSRFTNPTHSRYNPEWKLADPICSFIFAVLVLFTTARITWQATHILMEGEIAQSRRTYA
jgi:hypothetical protein